MKLPLQHQRVARSLQDTIARELTPLVSWLLTILAIGSAIGVLLSLATANTFQESLNVSLYGIATFVCVILARRLLMQNRFRRAVTLATAVCLFAQILNYNGLGTHRGAGILIIFVLPVAMAGFLINRRGLVIVIVATYGSVAATALLDAGSPQLTGYALPNDLPDTAILSAFSLVILLLGLFIDSYGTALRKALEDALNRQSELEATTHALEVRTTELENAKAGLERELFERQRTEAALQHERDLLHTLMDSLPDMIYFKDARSRFTRINQAQAQILGVAEPADAVGKTDFDFQPAELAHTFFAEEQQMFINGEAIHDRLEFNPTPAGKPRWISASKAPIRDRDGRIVGMVGLSRDITARYEIERMKDEFVATVSHELRTPLTSLRGSLALLVNGVAGELPPSAQSMLVIAQNNTIRLGRLVDDLLDLEKLEAGKLSFHMAPVDLTSVVRQALEFNREYARQFHVTLEFVHTVQDATIQADIGRLHQVLTNLLSNAAKFSPQGGMVEIAIERIDERLSISITDQGCGIPEEFRARIFSKFAQVDSSSTRTTGGTGLGLSIAKALVEYMGGQIAYTSKVGVGTTFTLDFPAAPSQAGDLLADTEAAKNLVQ